MPKRVKDFKVIRSDDNVGWSVDPLVFEPIGEPIKGKTKTFSMQTPNEEVVPVDWDAVYKINEREATGLDGPYYDLPKGATQLQDLIEYKNMDFSTGNIFKACYRLKDKGTAIYNLEKIIYYATRKLAMFKALENDTKN